MIKRIITFCILASAVAFIGCGSKESKRVDGALKDARESGLRGESDSLAYVIGLNIAEQLYKMDSTININVVCRAILEHRGADAVMNLDEARDAFMRYLLFVGPERRRGYEEQYLSDLAKSDRSFTRSKSGLTYSIEVIGDERHTPKANNDWVTMSYTISRIGGEQIYPKANGSNSGSDRATLEIGVMDMVAGVAESVKMIGKGGKVKAWVPSKLAYGEEGSAEFGIAPMESVLYDIEVVNVQPNSARTRKQDPSRF